MTNTHSQLASVNGIQLLSVEESVSNEDLRQRAYSELLRQEAIKQGYLSDQDASSNDGILNESAATAIEQLLDDKLAIPEPSIEACKRYHAANQAHYTTGERVNLRHILFAVTQGVDVVALRNRAETTLLEVRCQDKNANEVVFAKLASTQSNCPSGAEGGMLGWLTAADCAPEFAKETFGHAEVGVLPRLVHSRHGLHVVEVLERIAGTAQSFESVSGAVAMAMRQQSYITALRQYLNLLASDADIQGVEIEAADSFLVQ